MRKLEGQDAIQEKIKHTLQKHGAKEADFKPFGDFEFSGWSVNLGDEKGSSEFVDLKSRDNYQRG